MRSLQSIPKLEKIREKVGDEKFHSIQFVEADLTDEQSMIDACKGVQYVIHTASPISTSKREEDCVGPAVSGVRGVLKGCVTHKVK